MMAKSFYNLSHLGDLFCIAGGELTRPDPEAVLQPDADMAAHAGRHGGHPHLVGAGRQDRPVIIRSKKAVGRALQVPNIVRLGADAPQASQAGLDEKRGPNEALSPEIITPIEFALV